MRGFRRVDSPEIVNSAFFSKLRDSFLSVSHLLPSSSRWEEEARLCDGLMLRRCRSVAAAFALSPAPQSHLPQRHKISIYFVALSFQTFNQQQRNKIHILCALGLAFVGALVYFPVGLYSLRHLLCVAIIAHSGSRCQLRVYGRCAGFLDSCRSSLSAIA